MHESKIIGFIGAVVLSQFFVAVLFTIELKIIDFYSIKEKIFWFIMIWFVPVIGLIWFYQQKSKGEKNKEINDNEKAT